MKKTGLLIEKNALVAIAVLAILGCGSPSITAPSVSDAKNARDAALQVVNAAQSNVSSLPFNASGPSTFTSSILDSTKAGSLFATSKFSANPLQGPYTDEVSVTLANWHDQTSGYIFVGTVSATFVSSVAVHDVTTFPQTISDSIDANLTLYGGNISTLRCNYSETVSVFLVAPFSSDVITGTVTANGYSFDVNTLQ